MKIINHPYTDSGNMKSINQSFIYSESQPYNINIINKSYTDLGYMKSRLSSELNSKLSELKYRPQIEENKVQSGNLQDWPEESQNF